TAKKFIAKYGSMENLLANVDELKGKMKENIIEYADQGRLSKRLATIFTDCDVKFNEKRYAVDPPNVQKVVDLFKELEFRRLTEQFIKMYNEGTAVTTTPSMSKPTQKEAGAGQYSLFGNDLSEKDKKVTDFQGYRNLSTTEHLYQVIEPGLATELF